MSGGINFTNQLTFASGATAVLEPYLVSLFNQDLVSFEQLNNVVMNMGFVHTKALNPQQTFSIILGAYELPQVNEGQDLPILTTGKGNDKGFFAPQYGGQIAIDKYFRKWLEIGTTLEGADSNVKTEWVNLAHNVRNLMNARTKTLNQIGTQLFTLGWIDSNANGPGSPTPYGQPLFSATQPYGNGGVNSGTFQNVLGGTGFGTADGVLNAANLQGALQVHKVQLKLQNGDRVQSPEKYTLMVSRANEVAARQLLNTVGNQVGVYSGGLGTTSGVTGNAAQLNQFSFDGNIIELFVMPYLGETTGNGTIIGSDSMWFLLNKEQATIAMALRMITIWDAEVRVYEDYSNATTFVALDMAFTVDHYGAESFIVGSRGTV